ncbi:PilZ domain-containing protein [Vibrio algarum]|uniref:PilZ domain-containing protein n=1 Tax=Vibrio algarum TaxID=3020714 RepID=A0ABT4YXT4_9VIBR|nr:PilZ domain-containing protein [Vibrio sp. KJ40-1]MDB1126180.1 PilZ domain-containing protein [Vibrio sp. KJ40-1]
MSTANQKKNNIKQYLEFGMRLTVTIKFGPKDEYNLQCNLIGIKENQFMLLDMSQKAVEDLITRKTSNVSAVVRGITDTDLGHIIAFKTKIITVISRPTWLMFVRLPYNFESKPIREHKRFKLDIPITLEHKETKSTGTLRDLSASGCGIYLQEALPLEKNSIVTISPKLEHFPKDIPQCSVVNCRRQNGGLLIGIKFEEAIEIQNDLKYEILDLSFES